MNLEVQLGIAGAAQILPSFWFLRLVCQWLVYDSSLWRGDRNNTRIHVAATAVWLYFTAVYAAAALR